MKLLQVMTSNKLGGAERFFCRLTNQLQHHELQQSVMLRDNSPYVNQLSSHIAQFLAPFRGCWDLLSNRTLKNTIKTLDPNIVLSWMNRSTSIVSSLHRNKHYAHLARLGGFYNLKYYQHVDHFIANTKGIADYLVKAGIPYQRISYISNFVDEKPGTPLKRNSERPLLVTLGRLHTNKAFDVLIHAMTQVPDTELWIAGSGPLHKKLQSQIDILKLNERVKLLGWVENPQDLITTGDLFICPSRHEPLGNVLLEAWAQQKPIIATQSQGARELITHGKNGFLCPIDDPHLLANSITTLLESKPLQQQLQQTGYQHYQQHYSASHITNQYLELFHRYT